MPYAVVLGRKQIVWPARFRDDDVDGVNVEVRSVQSLHVFQHAQFIEFGQLFGASFVSDDESGADEKEDAADGARRHRHVEGVLQRDEIGQVLVFHGHFADVGDETDEIRGAGVAEEMRNEDLQRLGRRSTRRNHHVEQNIGDDGPVEAEEELGDKHQQPENGGMSLGTENDGHEEGSAKQQTDGADQGVSGFLTAIFPYACQQTA